MKSRIGKWIIVIIGAALLAIAVQVLIRFVVDYRARVVLMQRRNRLALVRELLRDYETSNGQYPGTQTQAGNKALSWRLSLLNNLCVDRTSQYCSKPPLSQFQFPLREESDLPGVFGNDTLTVFCVVHGEYGPNWSRLGRKTDNPAIVVEGDLLGPKGIRWSDPADIWYSKGKLFVANRHGTIAQIKSARGIFILRRKGDIEWHKGEIDAMKLIGLLYDEHSLSTNGGSP